MYPVAQVAVYVHASLTIDALHDATPVPLVHATQESILHKFETLFGVHRGVFHVSTFVELEQVISQLVELTPSVVLPAGHAVQLDAPAALYEPRAHRVAGAYVGNGPSDGVM